MFQVLKLKRGPKLEPIGTRHILHSNKLSKFHISHAVCEIFSFRHQIQKYMSKKSQDQSQLSHLRDEKKDQRICLACYKSIRTSKLQPLATKGNNLKTINNTSRFKGPQHARTVSFATCNTFHEDYMSTKINTDKNAWTCSAKQFKRKLQYLCPHLFQNQISAASLVEQHTSPSLFS